MKTVKNTLRIMPLLLVMALASCKKNQPAAVPEIEVTELLVEMENQSITLVWRKMRLES